MRRSVALLIQILAPVFCLTFVFSTSAQVRRDGSNQPLRSIPAEHRARFMDRLEEFVKLQGEGQWGRMYELSVERVERQDLTRDDFVRIHQDVEADPGVSKLMSFHPTAATFVNAYDGVKEWLIEGCTKYRRKGHIVYLRAGLNAQLRNSQWYFSYLSPITDGVDGPERRCTTRHKWGPTATRSGELFTATSARKMAAEQAI
jgi:hypothetical protein